MLTGVLAGYGIAIPLGAVAALIVATSAQRGWLTGGAAGLGAATADGLYAMVIVAAGAVLAPWIAALAVPLRWASVGVLVLLGVRMICRGFRAGRGFSAVGGWSSPAGAYLGVLGITLVNPATVVYFAALTVGSAGSVLHGAASRVVFVAGVFLASASWQLLLAAGGAALGRFVSGPRGRRWTGVAGGVMVIALAVRTALAA